MFRSFSSRFLSAAFCALLGFAGSNGLANGQDLYGFPDNGQHAKHHHIYQTLSNQAGTHCCPVGDCRPTQAKYENGTWYALVNGKWREMESSRFVREYDFSWNETPHVCAGRSTSHIYCFVRPGPGL